MATRIVAAVTAALVLTTVSAFAQTGFTPSNSGVFSGNPGTGYGAFAPSNSGVFSPSGSASNDPCDTFLPGSECKPTGNVSQVPSFSILYVSPYTLGVGIALDSAVPGGNAPFFTQKNSTEVAVKGGQQ